MLIVGELINTSRKTINAAVQARDAKFIKNIAAEQVKAGAQYIDVNCGTEVEEETEIMKWLVQTIQQEVKVPLCIDSPNPEALKVGLSLAAHGQPLINSITAEKDRFDRVIKLVLEFKAKVVALCMDDSGIPGTLDDKIRIVNLLVEKLSAAGVKRDDIYIDPLVRPISTGESAGLDVLETIRYIKKEYPDVHAICGLSNVSFGLPKRKVLNQTFLIQTMSAGMDAFILDPLDSSLMGFFYSSKALLGKDQYCNQYLTAYRQGLYSE